MDSMADEGGHISEAGAVSLGAWEFARQALYADRFEHRFEFRGEVWEKNPWTGECRRAEAQPAPQQPLTARQATNKTLNGIIADEARAWVDAAAITRHDYGRIVDNAKGLVPLPKREPPERVVPAFPEACYRALVG